MLNRRVTLIPIPAGNAASKCKSCQQTIYWAPYPTTGKMHPVSIDNAHGRAPSSNADGQGLSHFSDCPNAEQHRGNGTMRRTVHA